MVTITAVGTTSAYASIDVSSFDPLITDAVLIEALAKALTTVPVAMFPKAFFKIFATSRVNPALDVDYADAMDTVDRSRVFQNALRLVFSPAIQDFFANPPSNNDAAPVISLKLPKLASLPVDSAPKYFLEVFLSVLSDLKACADAEYLFHQNLLGLNYLDEDWNSKWSQLFDAIASNPEFGAAFSRAYGQGSIATSIGLLPRYRQHFFYGKLAQGPFELVRSLAPHEKLEVLMTESEVHRSRM